MSIRRFRVPAILAVCGMVAALVLGGGLNVSTEKAFADDQGAIHLELDAVYDGTGDPLNDPTGWCEPVDTVGIATVGTTHYVGICLTNFTDGTVDAWQVTTLYDLGLNSGVDIANAPPAVDDNPNANDGDGNLGTGWDCTGSGFGYPEMNKDALNDPVGDAFITCNADVFTPDRDLTMTQDSDPVPDGVADSALLAVLDLTADALGTDVMTIKSDSSIAAVGGGANGTCGVAAPVIPCIGASVIKVADTGIVKTASAVNLAGGQVTFDLALSNNDPAATPLPVFVTDDLPNEVAYNEAATIAANGGDFCDPMHPLYIAATYPTFGDSDNVLICGDVLGFPLGAATTPTLPVLVPGGPNPLKIVADIPLDEAGKMFDNFPCDPMGVEFPYCDLGGPGTFTVHELNLAAILDVNLYLTYGAVDGNPDNNLSFAGFLVQAADVSVDKSPDGGAYSVGDSIVYTVTATSNGPSPASAVVINDTVDTNQIITSAVADGGYACVATPDFATAGNEVDCTGPDPMPGVVTVTVTADVVDSVGNTCVNTAQAQWADPLFSAPAVTNNNCLPPTTRMEKDIDEDPTTIDDAVNLFLEDDGAGGLVPLVIYELVTNAGNDPDGIGAYEFQLKFDHKIFDIVIEDNSWLSDEGARTVDCSMTILTENDIRFGCVSEGPVPGQLDDGTAAIITVYPEADLVYRLTPGQDNGVFRVLLDENCELADVLGDPLMIPVGAEEELAPGILPGGLVEVCSDMAITVRILEGDLNLDCIVDVSDAQEEAYRYGASFGMLLYDPWYDLQPALKDFDIDIKDVQKVFGRQGSVCDINGVGTIPPQLPHEMGLP